MEAIVIGAGPAGLAAAACLRRGGAEVTLLEREDRIAAAWHRHYDRLHLHTSRARSALPFHPFPATPQRFPAKADVIAYLQHYAQAEGLAPRLGCAVQRVTEERRWQVTHSGGTQEADMVVFATGLNARPRLPDWPGLASFAGPVIHASAYHNADGMAGKRALVVGFGNSGGDIAIDLAQAGAEVCLSVRGPVNLLPAEIFGIPVTSMTLFQRLFGARIADAITAPVIRARIGRPRDYGLAEAGKGPIAQVVEDGRIPLIDVGALRMIRQGRITVRPGIARIDGADVRFADDSAAPFDALYLATGYSFDLAPLLPDHAHLALDRHGHPLHCGGPSGVPGLYFCNYQITPTGQLRQAGNDARAIARAASV